MASSHHAEDRSEDGSNGLPDCGDDIDAMTFEQILEMDDDEEEREFSRSIVFGFFDQAVQTFKSMDQATAGAELNKLSQLGHFLKGSSATLGLIKVKDACEKIQHYGDHKDANGDPSHADDQTCLNRIKEILPKLKADYAAVEKKLRQFYPPES